MADLNVLFKDSDFVAVDKPAGLAVHNNEDGEHLLTILARQLNLPKLYPVHRLDKETSGVQLLALNAGAAKTLAQQFESKAVKKTYIAILRGTLLQRQGVWNKALTDKAEGRRQPAGDSAARISCETRFLVKTATKYFTHCEFDLITGRQHQIRKHAALDNHPVVGDSRYGDPRYNKKMAELYKVDRMLLHCTQLEIAGHKSESPEPAEFSQFLR